MATVYSIFAEPGCAPTGNPRGLLLITLRSTDDGSTNDDAVFDHFDVYDAQGNQQVRPVAQGDGTYLMTGLANSIYTIQARGTNDEALADTGATVNCGPLTSSLVLDLVDHTDETAALGDGTATIQASGGVAPLTAMVVQTGASQPATSGQRSTFPGLDPGKYDLVVVDSAPSPQSVQGTVTIKPYLPPKDGCTDEYADNYDPAATSGDDSCTYSVRWRSAWQRMAVAVGAEPGQKDAFIVAELFIGFRDGHPLASQRPLGAALRLRATVGPDGYATFNLGHYLRSALGVSDGEGGYRLDLNTQTVDDLYVGYELRRTTGELLEHGYAVNAAVPDEELFTSKVLSSFAQVPMWPGYSWKRPELAGGRYGTINELYPSFVTLPCPANPLPIAWLNPLGGWDFWVFQGRTQFGDTVGDGQQYREASTGQQRYSDPGDAYQTFKASSGAFGGDDLLRGLRTLWRSPQAWVMLEPGGDWVPILIDRGTRDVGRFGVRRQEVVVNFQLATPEWAQGQ